MWTLNDGSTDKVTMPADGVITISKPKGVKVHAYINDVKTDVHHIHVKAKDNVHFDIHNTLDTPARVSLAYNNEVCNLDIVGTTKGTKMHEAVNLFTNPNAGMGGAIGGGMGAGLLGGILGGALLNNGGLFGGNRGYGYGNPATVTEVQQVVGNNGIMQTLGDIKASVPLAEAQVQLALAGAQTGIIGAINNSSSEVRSEISTLGSSLMNSLNTQSLSNQKGFSDAISATKDAAILAERNAWSITQAINADGEKTRALIQSIDKSNDSRTITNLANEVTELRNEQRLNAATGNITISNNNTATAVAQQQQSQQQFQILANLNAQVQNLANDLQTVRQNSVVFNSGRMDSSGNQSAANTRVA